MCIQPSDLVNLVTELRNLPSNSQMVEFLSEVYKAGAGDDVGQHEVAEDMLVAVVAIRPLVVVRGVVRHVLDEAAPPGLVAVQADEHPADPADPVIVEESRLADVAHLPDPADRLLPGDVLVSTHVDGQTLPLLLDHLTELVPDQTENIFGFRDVTIRGGIHLVRVPKRYLFRLGVGHGVQITGHHQIFLLCQS